MINKTILFAFIFVGCDIAMDQLDVTNGCKYIVTSKTKKSGDNYYTYRLIKEENRFYDYDYKDTADFNVGDTLVLSIKKNR